MGVRVFVAAGHVPGGGARGLNGLEEGTLAAEIASVVAVELERRHVTAMLVPHKLDLAATIEWINARRQSGDRAIELHLNAAGNRTARGALVAVTASSRAWGTAILDGLAGAGVPHWNKGVFHETEIAAMRGWHHLGFPHQVPNSVLVEMGFITSPADVDELSTPAAKQQIAAAIAAACAPKAAPVRLARYTIVAPAATIEAVKAFLRARKAKGGT